MGVPKIVLDHYLRPRNKRSLPFATVTGVLRGREPGKELKLHLLLGPDRRVTAATFENTGDRQDDPGASALTTLLPGRSLAELKRVDALDIARVLESTENPGIAMPAYEVLLATIAALEGRPAPQANEGKIICKCFHVPEGRIRRYVRDRRLATVDEVRTWTRANSGCRGCRPEIEAIIGEELGKRP